MFMLFSMLKNCMVLGSGQQIGSTTLKWLCTAVGPMGMDLRVAPPLKRANLGHPRCGAPQKEQQGGAQAARDMI
jgi:hypothetical protein